MILEKLKSNTRYLYKLLDVTTDKSLVEEAFQTQRAPGSTFTLTITADSHLDQNTDAALYQRTLARRFHLGQLGRSTACLNWLYAKKWKSPQDVFFSSSQTKPHISLFCLRFL